jgi:hypothetical protein
MGEASNLLLSMLEQDVDLGDEQRLRLVRLELLRELKSNKMEMLGTEIEPNGNVGN